jgi:hypothetical protein
VSEIVPVVLFAYRRADLLTRTLECLRTNRVPLIYAFSDGPRDASVEADVRAVRDVLRRVDWTRIEITERPVNYGVGESELHGITWVLRRHPWMVSVEEDLDFARGAYDFVCAGLERYCDDARVMGVTAWNHPRVTPPGVTQPYFAARMSGLLWGTWRRAWEGLTDQDSVALLELCRTRGIDVTRVGGDLADAAPHEITHGMWDHRFSLHMLAKGGLFLFPARSMVNHTGYDPRATNSPNAQGWEVEVAPAPPLDGIAWPDVREEPLSADLWRRAVHVPGPGVLRRARARLGRLIRTVMRDG